VADNEPHSGPIFDTDGDLLAIVKTPVDDRIVDQLGHGEQGVIETRMIPEPFRDRTTRSSAGVGTCRDAEVAIRGVPRA
jgi:hypothetical protein